MELSMLHYFRNDSNYEMGANHFLKVFWNVFKASVESMQSKSVLCTEID